MTPSFAVGFVAGCFAGIIISVGSLMAVAWYMLSKDD